MSKRSARRNRVRRRIHNAEWLLEDLLFMYEEKFIITNNETCFGMVLKNEMDRVRAHLNGTYTYA